MAPRSAPIPVLALAALASLSAPAAAQNTATEPPLVAPPPPSRNEAPPPATTAPPASTTPPVTVEPAPPVVIVPQAQPEPAPPEPVTIDPDAAYPNGFADPADPFGNDMSLAYREEGGFDWGLLGLLGLLGLIPLFRGAGRRVVYVERDDLPPRRTLREERREED